MVRITIKVMIISSAAAPRWRRRVAPGADRGPAEYLDRLLVMVPRSASRDGPGRQQVFDHPVAVDRLSGCDEMSSLRSVHQPDVAIPVGPRGFIADGVFHGGAIDPHGAPPGAG